MKTISILPLVLSATILLPATVASAAEEEKLKRQTLTIKFMMQRLEAVELTPEQEEKIAALNDRLNREIYDIRTTAKIDKDLIKKRDEVYQELVKNGDLAGDEFIPALAERLSLTDAQAQGFAETVRVKNQYKSDVMAVLTDQQKSTISRKKKTAKKDQATSP